MTDLRPIRHVARVTIETTAPLTIGTGRGDDLLDSLYVTDANGLPTIPGTSMRWSRGPSARNRGTPRGSNGPGTRSCWRPARKPSGTR